jgi:CheY-like chemotaxis protein
MKPIKKDVTVLLAEDDEDDYLLIKEAFAELGLPNRIYRVRNGEELIDFLLRRGEHRNPKELPKPLIILLDLNMPKKDGREALREIKEDPKLKPIPVVVLTTSKYEEDIQKTYTLGVSSYIKKPVSFDQFVEMVRVFKEYWFDTVELPAH